MSGHYNPGLVLLSVVMASAAAYVALDLSSRVTTATGRTRRRWWLGGALSMGTGVWSMHYLGMLAYELPVPVWYDVPTVLCSWLAAVFAAGVALGLVSRAKLSPDTAAAGGVVMGSGIAAMHYVGMEAMRFQGLHHYDLPTVAMSVAVAVLVSWAALRIAFYLRREARPLAPAKLGAAVVMGAAVAGMHYTGMAAATFSAGAVHGDVGQAVSVSALGTFGVFAVTAMVLALAVLSARADSRLSAQVVAARHSEERYRLLFNRSLAGVYQSTLDGRLIDGNQALARILGFASVDEMLGRDALDLFAAHAERERWLQRLRVTRSLPDFEHQLKRRDGRLVWVIESASLVDGGDGHPEIIEGTVIEITGRKEAEEQVAAMAATLQASLDRYRTLVETTSAIPWEMDGASLRFRYISPQLARFVSYPIDDALDNVDVWTQVHNDDRDRVRGQFAALAAGTLPEGLETEFRIHSGGGKFASVRSIVGARPAPGDTSVVLRGITFDVTAQRRLERALQQAQKLESVGRLAAGVAHEINSPVQFVGDCLRFLNASLDDLLPLIARYRAALDVPTLDALADARDELAAAGRAADLDYLLEQVPQALTLSIDGLERVATIVRSMKEFAHPDAKEMAAVDLNHSLRNTLIVARNEYRYVADVVVGLAPLPAVTCHGGEVNRAVVNIVVNAAHAIAERVRGTEARGRIGVRTWQDGRHVVIAIDDTGGGIPEAIRPNVFEPFFTTKPDGKGRGQGLAIARAIIVDGHGGDITFDVKSGAGTTFYLRLPIDGRAASAAA